MATDRSIGAPTSVRTSREAVRRVGFGAAVGGIVAFLGSLVASASTIAAVVTAGIVLTIGYALRSGVSRDGDHLTAARFLGTAVGLALAVGAITTFEQTVLDGMGVRTLGVTLFLAGFFVDLAFGTYERWRFATVFPSTNPQS